MPENKTLLSQNEIDTLIKFLESHDSTPIGTVLPQGSIDKLVEIIKFNNKRGIFLGKDAPLDFSDAQPESIYIKDEGGNTVNTSVCALEHSIDADGIVKLFCIDNSTGAKYPIFPDSLVSMNYVSEGSSWGRAVPPRTLVKISRLFNITCDSETLDAAGKRFAEIVYGDSSAQVAQYYLE